MVSPHPLITANPPTGRFSQVAPALGFVVQVPLLQEKTASPLVRVCDATVRVSCAVAVPPDAVPETDPVQLFPFTVHVLEPVVQGEEDGGGEDGFAF